MAENTPVEPAPEKMTRFQAQVKLGIFVPLDAFVLIVIFVAWVTLGYWKFFGNPTLIQLLSAIIFTLIVLQFWLVLLVFRVLVSLFDMQADINLMPEAAARIAVGYFEGRSPPK